MGMVRGGGYLALPLGAPSRGVVGPRPTEGLPDFGLLPIGKREGDVKKTPVIPPKGTRRQINESWYAAVARSEATWQSASPRPQARNSQSLPFCKAARPLPPSVREVSALCADGGRDIPRSGVIARPVLRLVVAIRFCSMFSYGVRENGLPRRFAPRNDSVI